ncbi:MAG: SDR family oxidoreductase, partial [Erysipelotrichaceae bacterium]|nr:SDR family oxidoreductase [Erysipelotrichaceae bacterium]
IQYSREQFDKYRPLLKGNVINEKSAPVRTALGNVFLTGATGFFGAHILDAYLSSETGVIYCLVRGGEKRLRRILTYYFDGKYNSLIGTRIIPVDGDITDPDLAEKIDIQVDAVIHSAATVKHFGQYEDFHRVNVAGTANMINFAKKHAQRMFYISTLSVGDDLQAADPVCDLSKENKVFDETSLYIGQPFSNVYARSKFEAECRVLDAVLEGLDAKIIRLGNLVNRSKDYKFQPNFESNEFLTRMKAIIDFGKMPDYLSEDMIEFAPVDDAAKGLFKIIHYAMSDQTVFHLNSSKLIKLKSLISILHSLGINFDLVEDSVFKNELRKMLNSEDTRYIYEAFQNDLDGSERLVYDHHVVLANDYTTWFLKRLGFEWTEIDHSYIQGYMKYFKNIGYINAA